MATKAEYGTRMADILSQMGIYETDRRTDRYGRLTGWSPDNPFSSGMNRSNWEKEQGNTYEERQAEARTNIQSDLDTFHSEFKGEYGYHWDDEQELRDIDKAWEYEGDAVSGYSKAWEDLKGTSTGDALQGLLDEGYHKPYDQSFDEYDSSIGWGFNKWNQETHHFKPNQPANTRIRESGYYTAGETDKLGLDLQRVGDTITGAGTGDDNKDLYRDLYRNAIDWDSYNQKDSMWQRAAQMARDDIDVSNLSNEERVGIYGIDWLSGTDAEGNKYGSFDREDEIRQVNQWMADRGWQMGDESTWGTELINKPPESAYEATSLIPEATDPVPVEPPPEAIEEAAPIIPATDGVTGGLPEDWQAQVESLFGQGQSDMQEQWSEVFDEGLESIEDIYTTKFDSWEDTFNAGQKALTDQLTGFTGDFSALTGDLDDLGDMFSGLDDSVRQQYSDLGGKIGNLEGQIGHVDTKLDDVTKWNDQISDVITDYQEGQIDQQERARAKASYGSMMGQPLNPRVRGVKTINLLDNYKGMVGDFGGARGSFNRKGNKLKIGSINV